LRTAIVATFYETLDYCFEQALKDILGEAVQGSVYGLLDRNRIPKKDVANRFDDVVAIMLKTLGACSRVIVQRTVSEMYKQYAQRINFSYEDSLQQQLTILESSVVANHLTPCRAYQNVSFDSLETLERTEDSDGSSPASLSHSGLYRYKKGTGTR
jgi:hypothetical protein